VFELKSVVVKDKKTGKNRTRYYAEIQLPQGGKIPLILYRYPMLTNK
jgi:hypothetical protein